MAHNRWFSQSGNAFTLRIHVQASGKKTECLGYYGDALKIRVATPPVSSKMNLCLVTWLADQFGVRPQQVGLVSGENTQNKVFTITGSKVSPDKLNPA